MVSLKVTPDLNGFSAFWIDANESGGTWGGLDRDTRRVRIHEFSLQGT
jgi:hypothetical protein